MLGGREKCDITPRKGNETQHKNLQHRTESGVPERLEKSEREILYDY